MRPDRLDLLLALVGLGLALLVPRPDPARELAAARLGAPARFGLAGGPGFRDGDAAVLPFERRGMEGPIRGAVVVRGAVLEEVVLFEAREGMDRRALWRPAFLGAFAGRSAAPPVRVDAVSGATVSSELLLGAVNERLQRWHERKR